MSMIQRQRSQQVSISGKGYGPNARRLALYVMSDLSKEFEHRIQRGENIAVIFGAPEGENVEWIQPAGRRPAQVSYYTVGSPSDFSYTFVFNALARVLKSLNLRMMANYNVSGAAVYLCEPAASPSYRHPCYRSDKSPLLVSDGFRRLGCATTTIPLTRQLNEPSTSSPRPGSSRSVVLASSSTSHKDRALRPVQPLPTSSPVCGPDVAIAPVSDTPQASILNPTLSSTPLVQGVLADHAIDPSLFNDMLEGLRRLATSTEAVLAEHDILSPESRSVSVMIKLLSDQLHVANRMREDERRAHDETRSQLRRASQLLSGARAIVASYVSSAVWGALN